MHSPGFLVVGFSHNLSPTILPRFLTRRFPIGTRFNFEGEFILETKMTQLTRRRIKVFFSFSFVQFLLQDVTGAAAMARLLDNRVKCQGEVKLHRVQVAVAR